MQSATVRIHASGRSGWSGVPRLARAMSVAALGLGVASAAFAQIPSVLSGGPPVQVIPYVSEPGVPQVTITPGTANPFSGADASGGSGTGGTDGSGGGAAGGNVGSSDALTTMESTSWGLSAVSNAAALGVNPSALAATCVVESTTCNSSSQTGSYVGAFQMGQAAYQDGLNTALAANPALASQIVQGSAGINDPTTQAIAAAGYLMQAAQSLQNAGIADPTVVQARGYFNFGPSNGVALAQADPAETMAQAMPNVSPATLTANGVTSGMTVSQWQAAVAAKMGTAANQSVLT
jgi:hypothetical protein